MDNTAAGCCSNYYCGRDNSCCCTNNTAPEDVVEVPVMDAAEGGVVEHKKEDTMTMTMSWIAVVSSSLMAVAMTLAWPWRVLSS